MQLSRFASKPNLRPGWSFCQWTAVASVIGGLTGSASAQTVPLPDSDRPAVGQNGVKTKLFAEPIFGQVPIQSPLSTTTVQNRPRLTIVPSLRTVYDSNLVLYPNTASNNGSLDNLRVTPGVDIDYNRLFGRVLISISGSAGYDYNSRFKILNQGRVNFSGKTRAPIGAICSFSGNASYNRSTFDLNEIQTARGEVGTGTASTILEYGIDAGCERVAGFSPIGSYNFQRLSRNQTRIFNSQRSTISAGLRYSKPSIGVFSIISSYTQIRRPFAEEFTGFNDDTSVYNIAFGINRAVSPRFRMNVTGGFTKAIPRRVGVQKFTGASYSGRLDWLPSPRLVVTGMMERQVTNQNGISATYVVRDDYTLSADLQASERSHVTVAAGRVQRDFRGESLTPFLEPLRADRLSSISANYGYDLTRRLRFSLGVSHRWRKADNPIYTYQSTVLSSSIGAQF